MIIRNTIVHQKCFDNIFLITQKEPFFYIRVDQYNVGWPVETSCINSLYIIVKNINNYKELLNN